jgi:cysteine desulfurase/selenocysteine lyase
VASGLGHSIQPGDEIVLSQMEHHANIVPWQFLRERHGAVLRFVPVDDDGVLDMGALESMLGPRTRMVAITHISNVLGTINPVGRIADLAHAVGAQVLIDGCQGIVHETVDVQALDADFYVFSGHKLYGPTGIGALYGKTDALAALPPYQGGGEMISSVSEDVIIYADPPHRFEAGTPPILEAIGLGAAINWLETQDRQAIVAHEKALYVRAVEILGDYNWLKIIGQAFDKAAIMSFSVEGAHAHDVAQILDRYGVAVRAGTHCAEPLMRRFGLTSSARASFALYNTLAEAEAFADALVKAHGFFA